ncbi:HMG-box, partial [Sistotremastrum suecicum HHB10207 ss-3]
DTTHVPRPANAFIIFRRYYTNNVHKPGTVDTSKSTLSRIIGEAWNALDPEQRKPFDDAAKREKAAHALKHPEYQFKPIHSKRPKK